MKVITRNFVLFTMFFLLGAIAFRFTLSHFLENRMHGEVWIIAVVYFLYNFVIGWFFGKKDYESIPLYDIGFRFHLAAYIIFNSVSWFWFLLELHSHFESIGMVYKIALFWGILLLVHFIFFLITRKNLIKGMSRDDIFE